ncbi:MAG: hypothetical protein KDD56_08085 [Bdellovibrionales bacterium]|nr:hypothetical protein [Bdellovibrionales bacterium]
MDFFDLLKNVFIEVAKEELLSKGESPSASKISAMTGVHRRDISRIETSGQNYDSKPNLLSKIIVQWRHHPNFTTKSGAPRVLNTKGKNSEFAELVESVNGGDINAYAILFEMQRLGIVSHTGKSVKLCWQDYVSRENSFEGLQMLAEDTADLFSAVDENISLSEKTPNLHLKTEFTKIKDDSIDEVKSWLLEEGSRFHQKIKKFLSKYDADLNPKISVENANSRVAFGSFSICENQFLSKGRE